MARQVEAACKTRLEGIYGFSVRPARLGLTFLLQESRFCQRVRQIAQSVLDVGEGEERIAVDTSPLGISVMDLPARGSLEDDNSIALAQRKFAHASLSLKLTKDHEEKTITRPLEAREARVAMRPATSTRSCSRRRLLSWTLFALRLLGRLRSFLGDFLLAARAL
jgi:hypothetical protein